MICSKITGTHLSGRSPQTLLDKEVPVDTMVALGIGCVLFFTNNYNKSLKQGGSSCYQCSIGTH